MRTILFLTMLSTVSACGGGDAPKPTEPAKPAAAAPTAAPEPAAPAAPDLGAMSDEDKVKALMEAGEKVYKTGGSAGVACNTCHQDSGEGMPGAFPPLKGSKDAMGDCNTHAGYVIKGLQGEFEVQGVKYNGVMPAQAALSDFEIAAVITYERNSWGNDYGPCMPEAVAAAR